MNPTIEQVQIPHTILLVLQKPGDMLDVFIGSTGVLFLLGYFFNVETEIYIHNCYSKIQIQKEYCKYLNNLKEGVISRSKDGIRYFNN